jgi:hypothetical protein
VASSRRSVPHGFAGLTTKCATFCARRPGASSTSRRHADGQSMSRESPRCATYSPSHHSRRPPSGPFASPAQAGRDT